MAQRLVFSNAAVHGRPVHTSHAAAVQHSRRIRHSGRTMPRNSVCLLRYTTAQNGSACSLVCEEQGNALSGQAKEQKWQRQALAGQPACKYHVLRHKSGAGCLP